MPETVASCMSSDRSLGAVEIDGVTIGNGSRVMLRPGRGISDAQDIFLAGRRATVHAILFDINEKIHIAVTLDDPASSWPLGTSATSVSTRSSQSGNGRKGSRDSRLVWVLGSLGSEGLEPGAARGRR